MEKYKLIGVPIKYGCNIEGADKGIDIIKQHIDFDYIIDIPTFEEEENIKSHNIKKVTKVCNDLAKVVDDTIKEGFIPITIGGDHSLAIGSIAGSSSNYDINLIWVDTHTDINTHESTLTGRIHGFPVASSFGLGPDELVNVYYKGKKVDKENITLFGTDDIDELEYKIIKENNIENILFDDIVTKGLDYYLDYLTSKFKDKKIHLSFDLDCMSPIDYSAISTPNHLNKGFTTKEAYKIIETILKLDIVAIDIVEYNPYNDKNNECLNILLNIIDKIKKS